MTQGKSILILGNSGTGKTLLAKVLEHLLESKGATVILSDDVLPDFQIANAKAEPEGTITIVTTPVALPSWQRKADVVIELNNQSFADDLLAALGDGDRPDWEEGELHG